MAVRLLATLRADNPGGLTLSGTNSYLLACADELIVVDPGPLGSHQRQLASLTESALASSGGRLAAVALTHRHPDHAAGAAAFAARFGVPVHAADPSLARRSAPVLERRELLPGLEALPTPGHTRDSVCLLAPQQRLLLSGDTLLGGSSTVIDHPDGTLRDYLHSLQLLQRELAVLGPEPVGLLPGHGAAGTDALAAVRDQLAHRLRRLEQVRALVAEGVCEPGQLAERLYPEVAADVRAAAEKSAAAQLAYLRGADGPRVAGRQD